MKLSMKGPKASVDPLLRVMINRLAKIQIPSMKGPKMSFRSSKMAPVKFDTHPDTRKID